MEQYVIKGGNPLNGEVEIGGAKNAALAILAASIMTDETVTIENLPNVRDINVLLQAIEEIGAKVERINAHKVKINGSFGVITSPCHIPRSFISTKIPSTNCLQYSFVTRIPTPISTTSTGVPIIFNECAKVASNTVAAPCTHT